MISFGLCYMYPIITIFAFIGSSVLGSNIWLGIARLLTNIVFCWCVWVSNWPVFSRCPPLPLPMAYVSHPQQPFWLEESPKRPEYPFLCISHSSWISKKLLHQEALLCNSLIILQVFSLNICYFVFWPRIFQCFCLCKWFDCVSQYRNRSLWMVKEHILGNRHLKEALKALITIATTLTDSSSWQTIISTCLKKGQKRY